MPGLEWIAAGRSIPNGGVRPPLLRTEALPAAQPSSKGDSMFVRKYHRIFIVSVLLLLACGIPGFAKNSRNLTIEHPVVVSGTTLPAGQYAIRWEAQNTQASVQFVKDKKVLVSAQCKFEDRGKKYDSSTVVYATNPDGSNAISEIRFAGSSQVLIFSE